MLSIHKRHLSGARPQLVTALIALFIGALTMASPSVADASPRICYDVLNGAPPAGDWLPDLACNNAEVIPTVALFGLGVELVNEPNRHLYYGVYQNGAWLPETRDGDKVGTFVDNTKPVTGVYMRLAPRNGQSVCYSVQYTAGGQLKRQEACNGQQAGNLTDGLQSIRITVKPRP
jgi:hypothetical protein